MPESLAEIQSSNNNWTMDVDNIFIVYNSDEQDAFEVTATKISVQLASYFSQDQRLYCSWEYSKINTNTAQRAMKIKNIMYDSIVPCLDQEELDRIEVLEVVNGPWFVIPEDPGPIPPPDPIELPDDPEVPA
ncbi:MAG: hypothetical protein CMH79_03910 [Nitrospinae bacterium]|nr:hypothetical protein [Nitrospinota bacterium]